MHRDAIEAAIKSYEEILSFLDMEQMPVLMLKTIKTVPAKTSLKARYLTSMQVGAAAIKIGDTMLERVSAITMIYLKWTAKGAYKLEDLEGPFEGSDMSETICVEMGQMKDLLQKCEGPLRKWRMWKHGEIMDKIKSELEEEYKDLS